jgi:hypothetical protein
MTGSRNTTPLRYLVPGDSSSWDCLFLRSITGIIFLRSLKNEDFTVIHINRMLFSGIRAVHSETAA